MPSPVEGGIEIGPADPGGPEALWCLEQYFGEIDRRFTDGFDRADGAREDASVYRPPHGDFLLVTQAGAPVGCGAVTFVANDFAEIKRMWISSDLRGLGAGRRLLAALEDIARVAGRQTVRLDSNNALREAHGLYRRSGYADIPRYNDNPYAEIWFEKQL